MTTTERYGQYISGCMAAERGNEAPDDASEDFLRGHQDFMSGSDCIPSFLFPAKPKKIESDAAGEYYLMSIPTVLVDSGLNRIRQEYHDLEGLGQDILDNGQITPICVIDKRYVPGHTIPSKPFFLIAGGRRTAAARLKKIDTIDAKVYVTMPDVRLIAVMELQENLQRENLSPQEELAGLKKLHETMIDLKGIRIKGTGHGIQDTASMLGRSSGGVSDDLKLAAAAEQDPELAKAKSKKEMRKILDARLQQQAIEEKNRRLREREAKLGRDKLLERLLNSYIIDDAFVGIRGIQSGSVDLVEIDPPYAVNLDGPIGMTQGDENKSTRLTYKDISPEEYIEYLDKALPEVMRVLKPDGWLLFWFPEVWQNETKTKLLEHGFKVPQIPAVWLKPSGANPNVEVLLPSCYERFYYARKGSPKIFKQRGTNHWHFPTAVRFGSHPAARPWILYKLIFETFLPPGSFIVSMFLGSGAPIWAAYKSNMTCLGWDNATEFKERYENDVRELWTSESQQTA